MARVKEIRVSRSFTVEVANPDAETSIFLKPGYEEVVELEPGDDPDMVRENLVHRVNWIVLCDTYDLANLVRRNVTRHEDLLALVNHLRDFLDSHPTCPKLKNSAENELS